MFRRKEPVSNKIAIIGLVYGIVATAVIVLLISIILFSGAINTSKQPGQNGGSNNSVTSTATPIPSFSGYIGDIAGKKSLYNFFFSQTKGMVVKVNLTLSYEQSSGLKWASSNADVIDIRYTDSQGYDAGADVWISLTPDSEKYIQVKTNQQGGSINGYLNIDNYLGPQMGIMTIDVSPVPFP